MKHIFHYSCLCEVPPILTLGWSCNCGMCQRDDNSISDKPLRELLTSAHTGLMGHIRNLAALLEKLWTGTMHEGHRERERPLDYVEGGDLEARALEHPTPACTWLWPPPDATSLQPCRRSQANPWTCLSRSGQYIKPWERMKDWFQTLCWRCTRR